MDLKLNNKVVLVTGAGSGIGREIARQFAEESAEVLIVGRTEKALQETAALNDRISYIVADLTTEEGIDNIVKDINDRYGRLDVLVNNAGWSPIHPFEDETMDEVVRAFDINVFAVCHLVLETLPMLKASKGNIVNISSTAIRNHLIQMSVYSAAKAAVDMFTKIWAKEFAPLGIRVNSMSPGPIESPIYDKLGIDGKGKDAHMARVTAGVPLGRFGKVEEVAPAVLFLASDAVASYITGCDYCVDGGYGD
ncbi:MAG: SDR family oxidoreductase [Bacteroides sp.]|nr:SDR family oxidoreductase [Bacteroides sp.]